MKLNAHKISIIIICSFLLLIISSCKKEDGQFHLWGNTLDGNSGQPLSNVSVKVEKQVVATGTFNTTFKTADSGSSDGTGAYSLNWTRENFAALRLICDKDQYISTKTNLDISSFDNGHHVFYSAVLYPEAFVQVHLKNDAPAETTDQLNFTFTNAYFDCVCCANGWNYLIGATADTTYTCKLYGDIWLKYQKRIITLEHDTLIQDSIFCPSFQTTPLEIGY